MTEHNSTQPSTNLAHGLTLFPTDKQTKGQLAFFEWPDLVKWFRGQKTYRAKNACPLVKVGAFRDNSRARGSKLLHVTALMGDYDAEQVTPQEALAMLAEWGIEGLVYTSASHHPERPRWRVVVPLSRRVEEKDYHHLMSLLNGVLGGILAPESWHWARSYYCGRVEGVEYEFDAVSGECLDLLDNGMVLPDPIVPNIPLKLVREIDTSTTVDPKDDPVAQHLINTGWALGRGDGMIYCRCPKEDQHTTPSTLGGSAWLLPTAEEPGNYSCRHTTHGPIGRTEFLRMVGYDDPAQDDWPDIHSEEFVSLVAEKEKQKADRLARFAVEPLPQFHQHPAPGWIIKGVLPRAQLVVIYGAPGSGKSFMALDMAMAVARGGEWRGRKVKQGRVVYVAAEAARGFRNRTQAYCIRNGLDDVPGLGIISSAPSLLNEDWSLLHESIGPADVIVVDTLSSTLPGGDENSAETMTTAIANCKRLADATGALVILVHHSGKDASKGSRGHSSLLGAVDAEFEVVKDGGVHMLRNTKQKEGEDGQRWGFALDVVMLGVDEDDEPITSCVVNEAELPTAVVTGGAPLTPTQALVHGVIQEMAQAQTEGIEVKAIKESVAPLWEGMTGSNFWKVLRKVCERMDYTIEGEGDDACVST